MARPRKILRDIALTLHYEYSRGLEGNKAEYAEAETLRLFPEVGDQKRIKRIVNRTREHVLKHFSAVVMSSGDGKDATGLHPGRILSSVRLVDPNTVEGYVVEWGRQEARLEREPLADFVAGLKQAIDRSSSHGTTTPQ